jgi:carboxymethylenebutenolidase
MTINTQTVTIPNKDIDIDAYLAIPDRVGIYPAIIVIQEIFGVNDHIRDVTRRIAQDGYIAIAPAIYQRFAPGFETGYSMADIEIGRQYKEQTKAAELISDIQATIDYLYSLPQVQKTGVGTIGFCFGGHVVYLVSTLRGYSKLLPLFTVRESPREPQGWPSDSEGDSPNQRDNLRIFRGVGYQYSSKASG